MKAHLLQVLVIDHDHLGVDEVERILEDANYPNGCIAPNVIKSQTVEVGDWDDDNPLNHSDTQAAEVDRLFSVWQPIETAPKDGTHILAYDGFIYKTSYSEAFGDWLAFDDPDNWALGDAKFEAVLLGNFQPHYWMPLPNPPVVR
jgi:hypothetical protein